MKKILIFILSIIMIVSCTGLFACSLPSSNNTKYDGLMNSAISVLKKGWEDLYNERPLENRENKIKIVNSRIVKIKDDTNINEFKNIDKIIEFDIYSDYVGNQGIYLYNSGLCNNVIIYKDGTMEVGRGVIIRYGSSRYDYSFPFISEVVELGSAYNKTITLNLD